MLRTLAVTRYVTPLREGGSLPAIVEAEEDGLYVLLFCRTQCFLGVRIHLDQARVLALAPDFDLAAVQQQLDTIVRIRKGGPEAGPLGQMSQSERFHWLVSPRSTIIQTSQVHSGLSADPEAALEHLLKTMVYR